MNLRFKHTTLFTLKNQDEFIDKILKLVDTETTKHDFPYNPSGIKKDYFGEINRNNFTIYQRKRIYLIKRIFLKINGEIANSKLRLDIEYYKQGPFIFSATILTFLSFVLIFELNLYLGLLLLIFVMIQTAMTVRQFENRRKKFIEIIEKINK